MNVWDQIKQQLFERLGPTVHQNWIAPTSFERTENGVLWVSVPNQATGDWLQSEYGQLIDSLARRTAPEIRTVSFLVGRASAAAPAPSPGTEYSRELEFDASQSQLNPKFTFNNFVVGACNQFAHAAAISVATTPSRSYNPLFIYGGVGMGKTHLMHAIGRSLMDAYGSLRIVYTSSERFMNEMITSIRLDRMPQFHRHYRQADVLLIDDIQVIGGKERTQEEFFHTFNDLFDHQKQIVLSSDSPPKDIPGLVERLRSRFEWGLMVDMQPPDLETKMAILDKKANAEGVVLPADVRAFIASRTKSNVRELEGALVKLIAYASLTGTPINLPMAQQCLKHLAHTHDRRVTIDLIQKSVADHFRLRPAQLKEKSNTQTIAFPRQIAMYLCKELTPASLPEIGRAFGGKHHTTVLHSVRKIDELRQRDPDLNRILLKLIDSLQ